MAAKETLLTGKKTLKKKTKHECKQQQQHRGRTNTLTIDNSDCLVLFKEGKFYTSDGFENKTLLQGEHQEPKPQQKKKKKTKNQKTGTTWHTSW
jgi:hypothetical protein